MEKYFFDLQSLVEYNWLDYSHTATNCHGVHGLQQDLSQWRYMVHGKGNKISKVFSFHLICNNSPRVLLGSSVCRQISECRSAEKEGKFRRSSDLSGAFQSEKLKRVPRNKISWEIVHAETQQEIWHIKV